MVIETTFVLSAASAGDFPRDGLAELALVGRSNVGKSSLINALVRQRVARTSAAPGKTRLANVYRVTRGSKGGGAAPYYLVDLPGYGYTRGGSDSADEFEALTRAYFERAGQAGGPAGPAALLLVDARHPGLRIDVEAWRWLTASVERLGLVATKIDKLSRAERLRAMKANQAAFEHPVLPVSANTGEGLEELWTLIDRLLNNPNPRLRPSRPPLPRRKN